MANKVAVLGPENSYSHILARKLFKGGELVLCKSISDAYNKVSILECNLGIVPIENMINGSVRESLISLVKSGLKIQKAYDLPIHHCIASKTTDFSKIISHTQAIGQCSNFLKTQGKEVIETTSTSKAMEIASKDQIYAAIGSKEAANEFGLKIISENIENNQDNVTRFILISKENKNTKGSRTSMMIIPKKDKPGLLFEILAIFKIKEINLTKIESIPTENKLGEYEFFIEVEGSTNEEKLKDSIDFLKSIHDIKIFGSYDIEKIY